jgi:potassium efflux system protein
LNNYIFFLYLAVVWFIFKSIIMIARICLVETTSHIADKDMRLYQRLMWTFAVGGVTTAAAVFVYQLPLIYELKTLSDRLFLLFMMIVSLMLLRFWDVVPNLIVTHMEQRHPYFEKSIKALGVLVPLLLFANSVIGLVGYLNLVMTISWYEGVFLVVLIGYLTLRGLLSDSVEQLSRVVIQHANNGWLLTEAFLKPLDRVLRLFLLFTAGAVLFLLYGWDKQSPIVEQLNALLHYKLVNVANTFITPISIVSLVAVISVFYWTAKWTREFVFRSLANRTSDMGIRNSVSILSQYAVVMLGIFFSLQVIGIDSRVLAAVTTALAFGMGLGLRDLANNFFCGFLILLERPLRVGDIICVNDIEGDVVSIGGRAVTVMTWDHTALVVPNAEIFNKTFTNLTARDNVLRCVVPIKISRHDNPHEVQTIIHQVISENRFILNEPAPEVFLKEMNDVLLSFELRYFVNIRQIKSRTMVISALLMAIWDAFEHHDISHPYPQQEIFIRSGQQAATALLPQSTQELKELLQHS